MKKLHLALESLEVQSFDTSVDYRRSRGTVRGNSECLYTGSACTAYWSTCDGRGGTGLCGETGMASCGCSMQPETCAAPCEVSDMTDCHRC